jgi:hypothetical protein
MRFFLSFIISSILVFTVSAENSRSIEWFRDVSSKTAILDFTGSIKTEGSSLPVYSETFKPNVQALDYEVGIAFPVFEKIGSEELKNLKPLFKNLADSIVINSSIGIIRKNKVIDLSFIPFIKKGNSYYRLTSFNWVVKPKTTIDRQKIQLKSLKSVTSSVLSTGKWFKLSVSESGIYKLTWQDITDMGLNPENVQIYGYGGALLEEDFSKASFIDDLPEVAVWKNLGSDGVFNSGDFLLFYAQGPISWKKNATTGLYTRERNHYSDKAYYFIGEREGGTKTTTKSTFSGSPNIEVTDYTDFLLHETEQVNFCESVSEDGGSGRELYGEDFVSTSSRTFSFLVPGIDLTQKSGIETDFAAHNTAMTTCGVYVNDQFVHTLSMGAVASSNSYTYATSSNRTSYFTPAGETVNVRLDYYINGSSAKPRAFLNYIILNVRKSLKLYGSSFSFRDPVSVGSGNIARYTIQNANASTVVFDVTDQQNMIQMNGNLSGSNYIFNAPSSTLKEYVCVDLSGSFNKPVIEGSVSNQNIHGKGNVGLVIISPSEFKTQALRLAEAHTEHDGMSVLLVTPEQVYNEFSSGTPDATAYRLMMKYFYDKASTEEELPKYLLLFGGGVYDNRMVSLQFTSSVLKSNRILTYQSKESLEGTESFVTDDYFGFLDDTEGSNLSVAKLDIGIGRFPVHTLEQAEHAVDKTLAYIENNNKGTWKNRLLYLADDGDDNTHMDQAETLASTVEKNNPEFMVNRIYVDAYKKVTTASGSTIPDGNNKFAELLNSGLLMLNYTGHGSTTAWTAENLLTYNDITAMTNKHLPLWVTATCDFTRYDALETSGGEMAFLNQYGGGVALFTTTRIVYSSNNFIINKSFTDNIFSKNKGKRNSLGEIMHLTKSSESLKYDRNKLSFTLIGDPALKLAYPEYSVKVTQINDKDVSTVADTLQALQKVQVSGCVYREDGSFADDFNGLVFPTILDSRQLVKTLGSNGADIFSFYDKSRVLFSGKDSVVNGKFKFTFIMPKDISYSFESGTMNFYAYDTKGENEAQGYFSDFVIGGTSLSAVADTSGPEINLFLNDENYIDGGSVNETPTLIARVSDENGLNTSGNGIGHDLQVVVDADPEKTFTVNNYFMADIGSFNSGAVRFTLPELDAGVHSLSFRAWDVENNSSIKYLSFNVVPGFAPRLSGLRYVQQSDRVLFRFTHDRPEVSVTVQLNIYDILGRKLWNSESKMQTEELTSDDFEWDMRMSNGHKVMGGIYICKVIMTDSNGATSSITEKIRLIPQ